MVGINFRQRLTYSAHLFKALTKRRFVALEPMLKPHIKSDAVIFDIGANAGYTARLFTKLAPQGKIYAFEPGSYARSILTKVVKIHGLKNISVLPFGLSDVPTTQVLHMPVKSSGSCGFGLSHLGENLAIDTRETLKETIALQTLDGFIPADMRVDFIKIDIEGWELRALVGGKKTIERDKPVLMLEMVDRFLNRAGDNAQKMWDFIKDLGYEIYSYDENGHLSPLSTPIAEGDLLCIHPATKK